MAFDQEQESYIAFRDIFSERTSSIVIWIGSGLSAAAGLPTWAELRRELCAALAKKVSAAEQPDRNRLAALHRSANDEPNPWVAFKILKESLGATTYREFVRTALAKAETCTIPESYRSIWKLRPSGVISLNLDRLASRAHSEVLSGQPITPFVGQNTAHYVHALKATHPFIANLHGIVDDAETWIFNIDELSRLLKNDGYRAFVDSCVCTKTILFLGISADDVAVGGHLERLTKGRIDFGPHFWLTNRTGAATDAWAEGAGVRVIRYRAADGQHHELDEFLSALLSFVPPEKAALPVVPAVPGAAVSAAAIVVPSPRDLAKEDSERIRQILNARAAGILGSGKPDRYETYDQFRKEYEVPIFRAWHVVCTPPDNVLLGYTVQELVAEGAFGRVFRATDSNGQTVAIKILHEAVRNRAEMLQGFRRGVSSMAILARRNVGGVVAYHQAAEIPTMAVMDYVDGPNLKEAVESRQIRDWQTVLRIAVDLARIIRNSHRLPERVLHRDIRPANIMLRGGWGPPEDWELVVLDFDLSWHRDAAEVSIAQPGEINGYLAPEQVRRRPKESTRNAAVDSFGTGMTLYFLRTAEAPEVNQHRRADWEQSLAALAGKFPSKEWRSLPARYFRLIRGATQDSQADRLDMAQVQGELERLQSALQSPVSVDSAELLAEEIAARCDNMPYTWDGSKLTASCQLPSGPRLAIISDESQETVRVELGWMQMGQANYKMVASRSKGAIEGAHARLKRGKWSVTGGSQTSSEITMSAKIGVYDARYNLADAATALSEAFALFGFT